MGGYYELRCFRLPHREAIMKRLRMKSSYLNDGKGYNAHRNVDMPELIREKPSHPHQDNLKENSSLTTPATLDKYPRGSCRLPCRIRQKLCPRRSSFENLPTNILSAKEPREGASLVLGHFGDLSGHQTQEQPLVHNDIQIEKMRKTERNEIHEDGTFELSWTMDLKEETFEMIKMPEVSSGVYIHDFTVNRTAIIEDSRCFVMLMDRNEIAPPRSFHELIKNIKEDGYELDLDEVPDEFNIGREIENPIENIIPEILGEFGAQLLDIDRQKRSTKEEKTFKEISKFSINYKILNYDQ